MSQQRNTETVKGRYFQEALEQGQDSFSSLRASQPSRRQASLCWQDLLTARDGRGPTSSQGSSQPHLHHHSSPLPLHYPQDSPMENAGQRLHSSSCPQMSKLRLRVWEGLAIKLKTYNSDLQNPSMVHSPLLHTASPRGFVEA